MKKVYALIIFSIVLSSLSAQSWSISEMTSMPVKISNNAVVEGFPNGLPFVYSFGGIDSTKVFSGISNRSFKYNVTTDVWDTIPNLPDPATKIAAGASYVNGKIYVVGGYTVLANGNEISSDKIHRFDPIADTFLTDGVPIPVPIDDHVQCVYKDSLIYIITGWSNIANVNNVQIYDTYLNTWTVGTPVRFNVHRVFGSTGSILGDTVYYFGGAEGTSNFPASNYLKKGAIDPQNPNQITWLLSQPNTNIYAYRPASTIVGTSVYWVGGSSTSYNYNGIAYNGSGGVAPANRSIAYHPFVNQLSTQLPMNGSIPMDLRGIASISDSVKYIVGGMEAQQQVSNKTLRLTFVPSVTGIDKLVFDKSEISYPNPVDEFIYFNNSTSGGTVVVFDLHGRMILKKEITNSFDKIDVKEVMNGAYLLLFRSKKGSRVQKMIVSH